MLAFAWDRIIPAYAGSTLHEPVGGQGFRDHPRIRGEHRMARTPHQEQHGIIPAYAGSTPSARDWPSPRGDHPRIRGEHVATVRGLAWPRGSSPHTRGALLTRIVDAEHAGIIPAYAGSTSPSECISVFMSDHPRIRGEHTRPMPGRAAPPGSSPHTRGAQPSASPSTAPPRIIPAYAGSTGSCPPARPSPADHPRIRGEHLAGLGRVIGGVGSSPHTRGARTSSWSPRSKTRIIPAYAGSTLASSHFADSTWDHPRIRGEHTLILIDCLPATGSSPHTRGAPVTSPRLAEPTRIIPAYAGST